MESQIELEYDDVKGHSNTKMVRFVGDPDATNVETVLEKICNLFDDGFINIVADFKKLRYVNSGSRHIASLQQIGQGEKREFQDS